MWENPSKWTIHFGVYSMMKQFSVRTGRLNEDVFRLPSTTDNSELEARYNKTQTEVSVYELLGRFSF